MKRRTVVIALCGALGACVSSLADANAFVQGAQPAFPTSPVPMPPSPGFKSLGTIPSAPTPGGVTLPPQDQTAIEAEVRRAEAVSSRSGLQPAAGLPPQSFGHTPAAVPATGYAGAGRLPAPLPSGGFVPPPAGASPQMISGYANNMDGEEEPPHMSMSAALKDGTMVRQQNIRVHSGKTYSIIVSGVAPNLIETPFRHPEMLVTNSKLATPIVHGQNLVVSTTPAFPVGVYVTGKNPHDPMISLTMIPKKIPPKNYRLIIPGFIPSVAPTVTNQGSGYAQRMVHLMRDAALKQVPENYRQSHKRLALPGPGGAFSWAWEFSWVGNRYRVTAYSLENTLGKPVNLMETNFYAPGVLSASIYPHHHLYPDEKTQVFVITKLTAAHGTLGGVS